MDLVKYRAACKGDDSVGMSRKKSCNIDNIQRPLTILVNYIHGIGVKSC